MQNAGLDEAQAGRNVNNLRYAIKESKWKSIMTHYEQSEK